MNPNERTQFINQLVDGIKEELLKKSYPDNWDGVELRWFIADQFSRIVIEIDTFWVTCPRCGEYMNLPVFDSNTGKAYHKWYTPNSNQESK